MTQVAATEAARLSALLFKARESIEMFADIMAENPAFPIEERLGLALQAIRHLHEHISKKGGKR